MKTDHITVQSQVLAALEARPMRSDELAEILKLGKETVQRACFNLSAREIINKDLCGMGNTKIYSLKSNPIAERKFTPQSWCSPLDVPSYAASGLCKLTNTIYECAA